MKYFYIYKIIFLKGTLKDKYYIGKRTTYNSNFENDGYFGSGIICNKYYKKYPPVIGETIIKEILEVCNSKEELIECEKKWIGDLYITDKNCVNLKKGGIGGWEPMRKEKNGFYNKHHSEETRRKLSEARKGTHLSAEHRQNISESLKGRQSGMLGKHHSEETRRKLSETHKDRKSPMKDKHHSEESKKKLSENLKGRKMINNGIRNKIVKIEQIEQYLLEGWVVGKLYKVA